MMAFIRIVPYDGKVFSFPLDKSCPDSGELATQSHKVAMLFDCRSPNRIQNQSGDPLAAVLAKVPQAESMTGEALDATESIPAYW